VFGEVPLRHCCCSRMTAPVRRRKRRALMRLRVGGLAGDIEQVAPTEVFVGDLVSRPGAAAAESAAWPR
jgi:hypothetical protein